ncbi:protein SRG1-like [Senna tora]|uniref:Protein SRG1-like n=1 Tax=Senna tora TaxID=362788 RepID=A0A834SZJ0_9FABA|nr:protein SRG1-like [Senna tora]
MKKGIQEFFNLPLEEKKKYWQTDGDIEGFGQAFVVSEEQKLDWSDLFYFVTLPPSLRKPHLFPKLPLPLRDDLETYSSEMRKLALKILEAMVEALEMDPKEMKELFEEGWQGMRMNYYPPCPQPELVTGINPHSDGVGLTILLQVNQVEGLQIRKDSMWVPIAPLPNAFIVNIGDILEGMIAKGWNVSKGLSIAELSKNMFFFTLDKENGCVGILWDGPWSGKSTKNVVKLENMVGRTLAVEELIENDRIARSFVRARVWNMCYQCGRVGHDHKQCEEERVKSLVFLSKDRYGHWIGTMLVKAVHRILEVNAKGEWNGDEKGWGEVSDSHYEGLVRDQASEDNYDRRNNEMARCEDSWGLKKFLSRVGRVVSCDVFLRELKGTFGKDRVQCISLGPSNLLLQNDSKGILGQSPRAGKAKFGCLKHESGDLSRAGWTLYLKPSLVGV